MTTASSSTRTLLSAGTLATLIALCRWARRCMVLAVMLLMLGLWVGPTVFAVSGQTGASTHIALDIMPVKPGGPAQNYAAYLPSTSLSVPAHATITVVIRNFDLDAVSVPSGAPYLRVAGTVGGVAYMDGTPYSTLNRSGVAHTFTVPALNINVPIPVHTSAGRSYVTVTFSFRTGSAGTFAWKCIAPCGEGPDGQTGPMADDAYMRGTLFVQS